MLKKSNYLSYLLILVLLPSLSYSQSKWTKIFNFSHWDVAQACTKTYNGNYIISGTTDSVKNRNLFLLEINENGDSLFTKIYTEQVLSDVSSIKVFYQESYI